MSKLPKPSFPSQRSSPGPQTPPEPAEDAIAPGQAAPVSAQERVKVLCRVRPSPQNYQLASPLELDNGKPNCLILHRPEAPVTATDFSFDRVS